MQTNRQSKEFSTRVQKIAIKILIQDIETLRDLEKKLNDDFIQVAREICDCKGIIWITAVGTSAAVAMRFAHILTCSGQRAMFLSPSDGLHGHTSIFREADLLIAISRGGESHEVNQMIEIAKKLDIKTIVFVSNPDSRMAKLGDLALIIPCKQEYELMGYLATTSTIAYSAMCDALCAVVAIDKGFSPEKFAHIHPGGAVGKKLNS